MAALDLLRRDLAGLGEAHVEQRVVREAARAEDADVARESTKLAELELVRVRQILRARAVELEELRQL